MNVAFAELLETPLRSGFTVPASARGAGIKMINMGELFRHPRIPSTVMALVGRPNGSTERVLVRKNDLLFARRSLTLEGAGRCSIVHEADEETTWESSIIRARLDQRRSDPRYYFYYFRSPSGRRSISTIAEQVAVAGIRVSSLARLQVPAPPLNEQQAIAEVLGALDDKVGVNVRLADQHHKVAVYALAVRGLDWVPMSDRLTPVLGGTPDRTRADFWGGDAPWLSVKDVVNATAGVVIDTVEHITDEAIAQTKAKPLSAGSVILTARGTVGEVARLGAPASFNQSCYGFAPDRLPTSVLYFAVRGAVDQIRQLVYGSVFDTITKSTFEHVQIPDFSDEAANGAEVRIRPHLDATELLARESRSLAALRDTLLPELMSGRLRVKDAERAVEGAV